MRRQRLFKEPVLVVSPDGKLLSEHTRITLIPHRITSTSSGQLLAGGVETHEDMRYALRSKINSVRTMHT